MRRNFPAAIALPLLLALCWGGCAYERYSIVIGDYQVDGIALDNWRNVQRNGDFIRIKPGGRLALRTEDYTQFLVQFDMAILAGTGANFYLRTVSHEFDPSSGILFRYAVDGCAVRTEEGDTIPLEFNADSEEQAIKILSEADRLEFSVGCDPIYDGHSNLEGTEYIIIEAMPDSEIELRAINYFDIEEIR